MRIGDNVVLEWMRMDERRKVNWFSLKRPFGSGTVN